MARTDEPNHSDPDMDGDEVGCMAWMLGFILGFFGMIYWLESLGADKVLRYVLGLAGGCATAWLCHRWRMPLLAIWDGVKLLLLLALIAGFIALGLWLLWLMA